MDDLELLRQYAANKSEAAFTTLAERYVSLVYSAARRQVRDAHLAEEVTQAVFLILAQKAGVIRPGTVLSGWLIRTTRFAAANVLRREQTRHHYEKEAMAATSQSSPSDTTWDHIVPLLDEALVGLHDKDRDALALRFLEKKSLREVGQALGTSEDNAQKRVTRALEKLRIFFGRHGHTIPAVALAGALTANSVQAAPGGLVASITTAVLVKGGAAAVSGAALCEATLHMLVRARFKLLAMRSAAALLIAATALLVVQSKRSKSPSAQAQVQTQVAGQANPAAAPSPTFAAASPALQAGERRFAFRVVDATNDAPLSGVKLTLMQTTDMPNRSTNELVTDRNGFGLLPLPSAEVSNWSYRIEVFRDGYVPKYVSWGASQGDTFSDFPSEHTTKLDPGTFIGGVVQNENGEPIAGVKVVFSVSGSAPGATRERERLTMMGNYHTEVTDAEGRWTCNHVPENFGMISWRLVHREYQDVTYYSESPEARRYVGVTPLPRESFLAGRALMPMKHGLIVAGVVTDEAGQPVAGAKVTEDHDFRRPEASLLTDAAGRFRFQNARERKLILTVQAEGFAPEDRTIQVRPDLEELRFGLAMGKPLRGRVLDEAGLPIVKAGVSVSPDANNRETFEWGTKTDEQGRFAWATSPKQPQVYSVRATGFESQSKLALAADGSEQAITLKKSAVRRRLRVMAHVSDADTKQPVDAFKVLVSEIRSDSLGTSTLGAEPAGTGRDGNCTFAVSSYASGFVAEIQADGYVPYRSTNVNSGQGEAVLEVELKKGRMVRGLVQLPNGQPVAKATVVLCAGHDSAIMDSPGQIQCSRSKTAVQVETDERGRFSFSPRLEIGGVVIAHKLGFAEATVEQLTVSELVTLLPWGRIEGVFKIGTEVGANETILLYTMFWNLGLEPTLQLHLSTKTDADGRFVFENVPAGELKVQHQPAFRGGTIGEVPASHDVPVLVKPGEAAHVVIGGSGRRISGQIDTNGVAGSIDWLRDVHKLTLKVPTPPEITPPKRESFVSDSQYQQTVLGHIERSRGFWASDAGKAIIRMRRQYVLLFDPDGSFRVNDVPPGTYELSVTPMEPPAPVKTAGGGTVFPAFGTRPIGSVKMEIVVPEADDGVGNATVNLGTIQLKPPSP